MKSTHKIRERRLSVVLSLLLVGTFLPPVRAAEIEQSYDAWVNASQNGLQDDTVISQEGVSSGSYLQPKVYYALANNAGQQVVWDSSTTDGEGTDPWDFDITELLAKKYGFALEDWYTEAPKVFQNGQEIWSDEIPGLFAGIKFIFHGDDASLHYAGLDYTKMSPLAMAADKPDIKLGALGSWQLPTTQQRQDDPLNPGMSINFESNFTFNADYIGPVPPLPIQVVSEDQTTTLQYLSTKAAKTSYPRTYRSEGSLGESQSPESSGSKLINLQKANDTSTVINYTPYLIMDPNAEDNAEGVEELKKDHGVYKIDTTKGILTFTPDKDFPTDLLNQELEGVRVVSGAVRSEDISDGMIGFTKEIEAYRLPKGDPRRTWVEAFYRPLVKAVIAEVPNLEAFGKIGTAISNIPNLEQDDGDSAIDYATLSFVESPETGYPETPVTTKEVPGEGTWTINLDTAAITFTPEKGFAGHPTPVYYMAKNVNGVVTNDDGDNEDLKYGVGKVNYTYSDASGLTAHTTGPQGEPQSSFDNAPDDSGFENAKAMFRNIPEDWFDDFTYQLRDANEQGEVVVEGQGTYTIDSQTGEVTFTPVEDFVGTAQSVVVEIASGYTSKNDQTEAPYAVYTPTVTQETESIPYDVEITYDNSLAAGEIKIDQEGELGQKVKVNGEWRVTKEAKPHQIRVSSQIQAGDSTYTWTEPVPYEAEYRFNSDLKPGEVREVQQGEPGEKTSVITITMGSDGKITLSDPETKVTREAVKQIFEVGPAKDDTKESKKTVDIPYSTKIVFDPTLAPGEMVVDQEGENGTREVTTSVMYKDGTLSEPTISETITKEPVERVVRVGAGVPKEKDVRVLEFLTTYVYDDTLSPNETKVEVTGKDTVEQFVDGEWVTLVEGNDQVVRVGIKPDPNACGCPVTPTDPGTEPGTDPGTDPGTQPDPNPGKDPGTQPDPNPGKDPGTDPSLKPETPSGDVDPSPSSPTTPVKETKTTSGDTTSSEQKQSSKSKNAPKTGDIGIAGSIAALVAAAGALVAMGKKRKDK